MLNEIESLKAQLKSKVSCITSDSVKPKVLAPSMCAIDVKPIPHPIKKNRSAYLNYINHLKESVEIVREIVEEARVVKPLDTAFNSACKYTKLSQELVEYVIHTCPKEFKERDNKAAAVIPLIRRKQVTLNDTCRMSINDTQKQSVNGTPTVKIVLNKGKQIWKPKGKLSDNSLNKTQWVWKATGKLLANVGYQWRPTGKKFTLGKLTCDKLTCDNRFTTVVSVGAALFLFQQLAGINAVV
ncbi:hypothetical protein Tco_1002776, partial [Tanacetum coccineum]